MRKLLFSAALLGLAAWAVPPAYAAGQNQGSDNSNAVSGTAGVGAALQGGAQEGCPEGQVRSANGQCAPGQTSSSGTISGNTGAADMPATPHQQQELTTQRPKLGEGASQPDSNKKQ